MNINRLDVPFGKKEAEMRKFFGRFAVAMVMLAVFFGLQEKVGASMQALEEAVLSQEKLEKASEYLSMARQMQGDNRENIEKMLIALDGAGAKLEDVSTSSQEIQMLLFLGYVQEAKKWPQDSQQQSQALEKATDVWRAFLGEELASADDSADESAEISIAL